MYYIKRNLTTLENINKKIITNNSLNLNILHIILVLYFSIYFHKDTRKP